MIVPKEIEVIQFTDEILRNCIDYGFFGKKTDWNPDGKILLYPIDKYSELTKVKFKTAPRINYEGESTFLRDPTDNDLFIPSNKYKDDIVKKRDSAIIDILECLGVTEYYIKTGVKGSIQLGGNSETTAEAKIDPVNVDTNISSVTNVDGGVRARYFNEKTMLFDNYSYKLTKESYEKAKKKAKEYGLEDDKEINTLLSARQPSSSSNSTLTFSSTHISVAADLNANLKIAERLNILASKVGKASVDCGLSKLLNFEMEMNVDYESIIIYNFLSEPKIDEYLKQKNNNL